MTKIRALAMSLALGLLSVGLPVASATTDVPTLLDEASESLIRSIDSLNNGSMDQADALYQEMSAPYDSAIENATPALAPVLCMTLPLNEWTDPEERCLIGTDGDDWLHGHLFPLVEELPTDAVNTERHFVAAMSDDARFYEHYVAHTLP